MLHKTIFSHDIPRYDVTTKIVLNVAYHSKRFSAYHETKQPLRIFDLSSKTRNNASCIFVKFPSKIFSGGGGGGLGTNQILYFGGKTGRKVKRMFQDSENRENVTCHGLPSTLPNDIAWQVKLDECDMHRLFVEENRSM